MSKDKFSVLKDVKGLHIRFLPEQEQEINISSREFLKQAEFINVESLVKSEETSTTPSEGGENQGDGTQGGDNTGGSGGDNTGGSGGDDGDDEDMN
jgi:hypothetical protein